MKKFKLIAAVLFASILFFTSCKEDMETFVPQTLEFEYRLHNGQTVPTLPYGGTHRSDFWAALSLTSQEDGSTRITATLYNTVAGETYHIHAHDAADPSTTPNGTPYNESPNADIFAQHVEGNGGTVSVSQISERDIDFLAWSYEGFLVIHDPLQAISTTDISTYLVVGAFGRAQAQTTYRSSTYNYDFNTGQLVADFAYEGPYMTNTTASIRVDELENGMARVTVSVFNSLDGEMYMVHAHDMADPATTPNGTPYNESPNAAVFVKMLEGNGMTVAATNISTMSYDEITMDYDGFFVIHDPLQPVSTTNPTTYIILGVFARENS